MSFPYHQYVDYSNPATPRVYSWDVTPTEQDAMHIPQQDPATIQQHQQHQQQQERVSPSQLQLQQLPPPPPPPLTTQEIQQHQQHQQVQIQQAQQHQQHQQAQYTPHPQTISLQPPSSQPQYRFDNITEEHFIQANATAEARPSSSSSSTRRRGASKPPLHVDTSRGASVASPGALSSAGAGVGPLRAPRTRAQTQSAHPYRCPQSRAASGSSTASGPGHAAESASVRTRRVSEMQHTSAGGAMPAVGTAMAVSCPASDTWKEGLLGLSEEAGGQAGTRCVSNRCGLSCCFLIYAVSHDAETTSTATPRVPTQTMPAEAMRRYSIRADIHYNTEDNLIIAVFELPGVKRSDLRITMSVCPHSRVRQINIAGIARPILPVLGHGVRERKYGQFVRTLPVPPETKPEDVKISLEDGILTLTIPGGAPTQVEPPQELPIP
ncbi:hypothetical protein C8Q73DRAFT_657097 [Cubamyces lactineus]|nr:hypothetical protein C8Q73DRAFT_657097 [Cubamyces lactineus]